MVLVDPYIYHISIFYVHNFYLGMHHDYDVGCLGNEGYMSSTAGKWSTCSKEAFLFQYNKVMSSEGTWCLPGNFKKNLCI